MAKGRMLEKVVSDSKRLPKLKTDSARLLWTWILPYLDIEGRCLADPDMIKGKIVPRLKTFTPENITEYLEDMADVGLIILYEIDEEKYLQFRNFQKFQTLREDREGKSKLPPPPKLQQNSGGTPTELPEFGAPSPAQYNIKSNLKEANSETPVVDNPQSGLMASLKTILEKTKERYPGQRDQQKILVFVQANLRNKNHDAILHCIESLIKNKGEVKAIPQYLEAALKIENGKFNAAELEKQNNEFKRSEIPKQVGDIIKTVGKDMPAAH